jgi:DNA-binding CsgD family transcriptional regulator
VGFYEALKKAGVSCIIWPPISLIFKETPMIKVAQNSRESQEHRLKIKTLNQQMQNVAVHGAGLSPWEAKVLIEAIEEVYFADPAMRTAAEGQLKYSCVAASEPPGKKIEECRMVMVLLTLFDTKDQGGLEYDKKQASITLRQRRLTRITDEAREQGGLLSQEDMAEILMCDVRTIRRDIQAMRKRDIIVATRGQVRDIGPGVTHRGIAVRLWLEGKEPVEIARHINHSIAAVENYIEKFKRVAYLRGKNFDDYQSALTIGISVAAVKTFVELYKQYQYKSFFKQRIDEIELVGSQYYTAQDEKKDSTLPSVISSGGRNR